MIKCAFNKKTFGGLLLKITQEPYKSSHPEVFPAILLKMRLRHSRFLVNFANFLRAPFLQNSSGRLLL